MTIKHLSFALLVISFVSCDKIKLHTPTHIEIQRLKHGLFPMTSDYTLTSVENYIIPVIPFGELRRESDNKDMYIPNVDMSVDIEPNTNYYVAQYQSPSPYLHKLIYYKDSSGIVILLNEKDVFEKNITERSNIQIHHLYDIIQDTNYYYTVTFASSKCIEMAEQAKREMYKSTPISDCGTGRIFRINREFPELTTKSQTIDSTTYKHLLQATPFVPPY